MSDNFLFPIAPFTSAALPKQKLRQLNGTVSTRRKSLLIKLYLDLFVKVTFRGTYIDAFAGPQEEDEENPENWSAKRLWESNPGSKRKRIDRFELIEKNPISIKKLNEMISKTQKDKRRISVYHGDSNVLVPKLFREKTPKNPTFCLLDQRTIECDWSTVKNIASYQIKGHKPEIFYFMMASWKDRSLAVRLKSSPEEIGRWWGRPDINTPKELSTQKLAELFSERFKNELGYRYSSPFPIWDNISPNENGKRKFYMIHATDHDAAPHFMVSAYNKLGCGFDPKTKLSQGEMEWTEKEMIANLSFIPGWKEKN
jgi:three-Cys-motif partner protein